MARCPLLWSALKGVGAIGAGLGLTLLSPGCDRRAESPDREADLELKSPALNEIQVAGFELLDPAEVTVEAVGRLGRGAAWRLPLGIEVTNGSAGEEDSRTALSVAAWILDARTRRAVWRMSGAEAETVSGSLALRRSVATISLPKGAYELYLASFHPDDAGASPPPVGPVPWWQRLIPGSDPDRPQELTRCRVALHVAAGRSGSLRRTEAVAELPGAIVRLNRTGDSVLRAAGFELLRSCRLRVYAVVEHAPGWPRAADSGWIVEAGSRRRVWDSSAAEPPPAGGGRKNRLVDAEIELPAGNYVAYFGTDGSHSFPRFNAPLPDDPFNWGLTILPAGGTDPSLCRERPDLVDRGAPLFERTRVGDDVQFAQRFRLTRDGVLIVRALGEGLSRRSGPPADGARITRAEGDETVWELSASNRSYAGGSTKNWVFDGEVPLTRGDYLLRYWTDDSHSFPHWNAAPPYEPETWGVTVWAGPGLDRRAFVLEGGAPTGKPGP